MSGPDTIHHNQGDEERAGDGEADPGDLGGVKECDHQNGADVVGDGERGEKDLERSRHAIAEEREHAEGEGDVGCHWHAPSGRARARAIEKKVKGRRHEHAAERCDNW